LRRRPTTSKIKHIALSTRDVEGTGRSFIEAFGMKKIGTIDDPGTYLRRAA